MLPGALRKWVRILGAKNLHTKWTLDKKAGRKRWLWSLRKGSRRKNYGCWHSTGGGFQIVVVLLLLLLYMFLSPAFCFKILTIHLYRCTTPSAYSTGSSSGPNWWLPGVVRFKDLHRCSHRVDSSWCTSHPQSPRKNKQTTSASNMSKPSV